MAGFGPVERLGPEAVEGAVRRLAARGRSTLDRSHARDTCGRETDMPLADRSDEALLSAYLEGDRACFRELVERYRTELHRFLTRFLGSTAAADDVFQETFLQVHLAGHSFDAERHFKPWLFTIAANKARDWHRRQKRRAAASLDAPLRNDADGARLADLMEAPPEPPSAATEANEQRELVEGVLRGLPVHYREVLVLSYFQRMSYNQVAEVLGIPLGTVKSRLHAAVAAFSERWKAARAADDARASRTRNQESPE